VLQRYWFTDEFDSGLTAKFDRFQNAEGHFNPFAYPWWGKPWPEYPKVPTLEVHVGYKRFPNEYDIEHKEGLVRADQILFSHNEMKKMHGNTQGPLRAHIKLKTKGFLRLRDEGWVHIPDWLRDQQDWNENNLEWLECDGYESFQVLPNHQPVLVIQNTHDGQGPSLRTLSRDHVLSHAQN
jgi:hypothetical protein